MKILKSIPAMSAWSEKMHREGKKIGFIPTLGFLHEGHLSLVEAASRIAGVVVVVSIFVNPLQFGPREDFKTYPRSLKHDKKLLQNFKVEILFIPQAKEMYKKNFKTGVEVADLSHMLCGKSRPGHFRGVATVVLKLFQIVKPDFAFFGEKDYQQQIIIKKMVKDLNLPVEIVSLPTVREFDGLALSSRNIYLNQKDRKIASCLYQSLLLAKEEIKKGEKDPRKILLKMRSFLAPQPRIRLDYVALVHPESLQPLTKIEGKVLVAIAAYIGKTRLIDNLVVES